MSIGSMNNLNERAARDLCLSLRANAAFSTICGAALLGFADPIGRFIGIEESLWIRLVGAGLLGFALVLFLITRDGGAELGFAAASLVIAGDFLWVAASAAALAFWPEALTLEGRVAVVAIAAIVLAFGVAQSYFLRKRAP